MIGARFGGLQCGIGGLEVELWWKMWRFFEGGNVDKIWILFNKMQKKLTYNNVREIRINV